MKKQKNTRLAASIFLLLISVLQAGYSQVNTPKQSPSGDSNRIKLLKKIPLNAAAMLKQPLLSEVLIQYPDKDIRLQFNYDENSRLNKITYTFPAQERRTGVRYLFYDSLNRVYHTVMEITDKRNNTIVNWYSTLLYRNDSRPASILNYNNLAQRTSRVLYRYNGDSIVATMHDDATNREYTRWYLQTPDKRNILVNNTYGLKTAENIDFLPVRNPVSFLPPVFNEIYIGNAEWIWYVLNGCKDIASRIKYTDEGQTSIVFCDPEKFTVNSYGWVKSVWLSSESNSMGTMFRFKYYNE